jgi:hypothetical protein
MAYLTFLRGLLSSFTILAFSLRLEALPLAAIVALSRLVTSLTILEQALTALRRELL